MSEKLKIETMKNLKIYELADKIRVDWKNVSPYAKPYLDALSCLESVSDSYGLDSASNIIARFLSNASGWRGDVARSVKAELKSRLN